MDKWLYAKDGFLVNARHLNYIYIEADVNHADTLAPYQVNIIGMMGDYSPNKIRIVTFSSDSQAGYELMKKEAEAIMKSLHNWLMDSKNTKFFLN